MALLPFLYIHIGIDPVAFQIGGLAVRWYGVGYVVAIFFGLFFARRYLANRGVPIERYESILTPAIIAGFIGGRLYYVVQNDFVSYLEHPWRIVQVWNGGMAFFGAIFAVLLVLVLFAWRKRWELGPMLDVAALFALMGQPIGRIGNVINGDIIGQPTHLPWGFVYTNPNSFAPSTTTAYQPAAIYEIICNLVLIAILFPLRKRLRPGWMAIGYVGGYAITQLIVFTWRTEPLIAGLRQAQWTSLAVLTVTVVVAAIMWRRSDGPFLSREERAPAEPVLPAQAAPASRG